MSFRLADRMAHFDSSGIRKVFDLAAKMKNPINLSIGQPHFDVPEPIRQAAIDAIRRPQERLRPDAGHARAAREAAAAGRRSSTATRTAACSSPAAPAAAWCWPCWRR